MHNGLTNTTNVGSYRDVDDPLSDADRADGGTDVLLALRDVDDRLHGRSRFAHYLARNRTMFHTGGGNPTTDPARFAAVAFQIASPPVMDPPYIAAHTRLVRAYPLRDQSARRALVVELAMPTPRHLTGLLPDPHRGWERDDATGHYRPPTELDQPTVHLRLTIGVPIRPELLPQPRYDDHGNPDLDTARTALRALTTHVSALCAHLISGLDVPGH